jgi:NAD(P)-dependent dehydrogenase (short-subunit alcohol dehydrogenase family)
MTGRLEGKVALITGGANGIGRACSERFASEGAKIVIADLLDEPGERAASEIPGASFVHLDATSPSDNEAAVARAVSLHGGVDLLVTAAGISHARYRSGDVEADRQMFMEAAPRFMQPGAGLVELDPAEWQKVLDVNLTGTMLAVRAVATHLLAENRKGSIVTIASIAAKVPEAGPYAYGCSKAAVWMFTKCAARGLAPAGIRVNAIGPGYIETNMTAAFAELQIVKDMLLSRIPMGRTGMPEEVASVALFLASDDSSYMTGELLHPDGGFYTD